MKTKVTVLIGYCLAVFGCSTAQILRTALEERDDGDAFRMYEQGEATPFSGIAYEDYPDGRRKEEISYRNGRRHGPHRTWYTNGQLEAETFMADGQWHGRMREWFSTGQIKFDVIQSHGAMNGTWHEWHENGQLSVLSEMKEGLPVGTYTEWSSDGTKTLEMHHNEAGRETGGTLYHPNGLKACQYAVVNGTNVILGEWGNNGNTIEVEQNKASEAIRR